MSLLRRSAPSLAGNVALVVAVFVAGLLYASGEGASRDALIITLFVNVVLVLGFQVFIGNTGILSFGHLGFAGVAAYTMALLAIPAEKKARTLRNAPWGVAERELSTSAATVIAIAVVLVVGLLVGLVVARTSGLAATMITLAFVFIVEQLILNRKDLTGGNGLTGVPRIDGFTWPLVAALGATVVAVLFRSTAAGRLAVAAREDELAAGAMGVRVFGPRLAAFVVSVGLVALGGVLSARSLGTISPKQFGFDLTIPIMAMLVVGGMRTVSGAITGAVFITAGKELARYTGDWLGWEGLPDLFLAGALLIVLLTRPGGLLGEFDLGDLSIFRSLRKRIEPPAPESATESSTGRQPGPPTDDLVVDNLGVMFGGFTAVVGVSMRVRAGSVHGLIGPNGAGKTTVINLITGVVEPTSGTVAIGATQLDGEPHHRARRGIARTFQNLRVFGALTVRENITVADLIAQQHRSHRTSVGVDRLLQLSMLESLADRPASTLDYGNQRRLEIARAAALRPDFLLLDEPTSGMSESESLAMVDDVRRLAEEVDAGVLVIDHDLGFITRIAERITVLDQGRVICEGPPAEVQRDPAVIAAYLGSAAPVASEPDTGSDVGKA